MLNGFFMGEKIVESMPDNKRSGYLIKTTSGKLGFISMEYLVHMLLIPIEPEPIFYFRCSYCLTKFVDETMSSCPKCGAPIE